MPNIAKIVDDIALVKSVHTEAINHDPAITCINTASTTWTPKPECMVGLGTWQSNQNLPGYVVMISRVEANLKRFMTVYGAVDFFPLSIKGVKFRHVGDQFYICLTRRIDDSPP